MILQQRGDGTTLPFTAIRMGKRVRKLRDKLKLPETFTLDACRQGGMTELEEAELTDGQGRALSGHRTERAYQGYAKRTLSGPCGHQEAPRAPNCHLRWNNLSPSGQPARLLPWTRREQSSGIGHGRS
jgi:hypothetical protein